MQLKEYDKSWEMRPRKLSAEEVSRPEMVIEEFFQFASLPEARACLWEMLSTMVTGTYNGLRKRERSSLLFFYERVEKLIEGVHVMYDKNYCRPLHQSDRQNDVCTRLEQVPPDY